MADGTRSEARPEAMETSCVKGDFGIKIIAQPGRTGAATAEDWQRALAKVVPAVVVLRTTAARAFDTETAMVSDATGFVVDKARGIILTTRHVVKPGPVVAEAMFVDREDIQVHPMYRDPIHDFGFFRYNPKAIRFLTYEEIPLTPEAACVGLEIRVVGNDSGEKPALRRGDSVYLVGLSSSLQVTSRKSIVTNPCAALNIGSADCPRYRATNMELIELDTDFGSTFSGVLTDEQGKVQALWANFSTQLKYGLKGHQFVRGIPIYAVSQVLEKIIHGTRGPPLLINGEKRPMPLVRILEVELYPTLLSKARNFGLSDNWVQALAKKDPIRRQVLQVKGCLAGSKAEGLLAQGDMILAINKEPTTCFLDIENACKELDKCDSNDGELKMTILRQGQEREIVVGTDTRDGSGTTRVVNWCGCTIQDTHSAVRALGFLPKEGHGVYVSRWWCYGSPVHTYGLFAVLWIVEMNGKLTPDLETFLDVVKGLDHGEFVRVRTHVLTLKQNLHYWPTWELKFDPETAMWRRRTIKAESQ